MCIMVVSCIGGRNQGTRSYSNVKLIFLQTQENQHDNQNLLWWCIQIGLSKYITRCCTDEPRQLYYHIILYWVQWGAHKITWWHSLGKQLKITIRWCNVVFRWANGRVIPSKSTPVICSAMKRLSRKIVSSLVQQYTATPPQLVQVCFIKCLTII